MFNFFKALKKEPVEHFLNDNNIRPDVLKILQNHRESVKLLSDLAAKYPHCQTDDQRKELFEKQEATYQEICMQEKFITKFGYTLVIEAAPPYAWALDERDYKKYLEHKRYLSYLKWATF
jgi:hypothetical protein